MRPVAVDLFAGAGGLSLGFEQAGFDVVAAVEYDPIHAMVHRFNFPECEVLCRDVRSLSAADVLSAAQKGMRRLRRPSNAPPKIDVLIGGPSCQGFSSIGRRDEEDDRNDLLLEFARLVREIKPRAFVLENVPGLLEPRFSDFRKKVFAKLKRAGYQLGGTEGWVDANQFGVAQVRKRVVIVGILDGSPSPLTSSWKEKLPTVSNALEGLPEIESYDELLRLDWVEIEQRDRLRRLSATSSYARILSGVDKQDYFGRPRTSNINLLTNSLRTVHGPESIRRFAATAQGTEEPVSRLFRLALDLPARTLRAGTGSERGAHTSPRPIHPIIPRVITVREAARIHGYPDWFRLAATNWHGHRQVGNSVPPPLARAAGEAVLRALGLKPRKLRAAQNLGDAQWLNIRPFVAARLSNAVQVELPAKRIRKNVSSDAVAS
ncbi:DNA (cytosine-5-)-methyltransferase [Amycolatopsis sp. WAC 01375]|nr:DNA (cytosine-5-)-methyltransferase [Amycolatopsis sp. WAC 01375]